MSDPLQIRHEARLENLPHFREFIARACREAGMADEQRFGLELAVDEVCANVILHGYAGREPGPLALTFHADDGLAVVTVADRGTPFSPDAAPHPDLEADWNERKIGGLGVYLLKKLVDEYEYRSSAEAGNLLTLRQRLNPPPVGDIEGDE